MEINSISELAEVERITKQLRLLNEIQAENFVGSWERVNDDDHFFWSDSMFILHELPVSPDNLIAIEEADGRIHKDDLAMVWQKRRELEESGVADYYFRIVMPDAHVKRIHAREKKITENGNGTLRGCWQDAKREKEITQSHNETIEKQALQLKVFERAEEVAQAGSWQVNLETFETVYSDNVYRIYALSPQSISPHVDSFRKYVHPADREIVLKTFEKAYLEMIPVHLEYRIVREDGEVRYISQVSHLVKNRKGEHILSGSTQDITEQKLLENQLRESNDLLKVYNELFMQAEQIGRLGTWQINLETRKTIYSDNLYRLYGLKPQMGQAGIDTFLQYIHSDDRAMVEEAQEKVFNGHILPQLEFRVTRADGKHRTFRQSSKVVKTNGELLMTGVVQDITEQRQKDRQLKEANEKLAVQNEAFRHAEKVASIGMWTWNLDTGHTYYSDNIYLIYGLKPQSIAPGFENFGKYMHPDDRERMKQMPANIEAARTAIATSYRIIRTDGEMRYLRSRSQPITSPENHTIIIGSTQDVTDEVQLHQQLQEEIRFAEILSDTIVDRIIVTDNANNIISWNKSCETVYNIGKDDVIGRNFFDVFPELRIAEVKERFKKALNGEMIHIPIAPSIQTAGYHELFMVPFKDENGKISGILHVLHDVTHLLQLQEQLSARLLFIEKLLESSINRIIVLDNDLHFQLWNRQCETFFGRKKEDVLQKHVLEIFPKFMTDHLYPKCLKAFEGDTVYVPADETAFPPEYYETYFIPLRNDRNETTGVLWITHDLGERFLAQQKLKTSERHLKTAQEIALMGSYEFDISNKQLKLSEQVFRICDYPSDEPITIEKLYASVHSHDLQAVQQMLNGLQNDLHHPKDVYESHFRIIRANGQVRHLYTRGKYEGPEGSPEKFTGIVHDITEKKMAEEELAKQQELLRQAEEIAHIGSWELDPVADEMYWSDEIFRIYRYEPQSFVPVLEFYINTTHPEDKEQLKNAISQAVSHARLQALRYRIFTVDGNIRYIQTGIRPLCDASGRVIRLVATMQDITEQKKLEDELNKRTSAIRTQYQMDRHTEKIKNLASWQWNTQTGKITWGEHLYRLFGRAPHSFEPSVESFIEVIHPDDREKVKNYLNDIPGKNPGALPDQEFRVTVNEKIRYMRFSGRVITNTFVVGSVLDTTEDTLLRRQLAERISSIESLNRKLEEKNKKLEEINEELTSFAFVASHDLREPLRKIQIFSDWLCKKETAHLSPDGLDRFQRIQAAVHRMDVLIDDILSFSHVNTADKKLIDVPLNKILENVKSDLAETISHTKAVITSDSLPVIKGNASQLSQLFQNLIGNALKYQEPGSMPEINIRCEHISGKNINYHAASHELDYVKISFTDNGIGFDEQYSRKIFQMFQRLHGINEYPGTGMGLAICKKITEHHNGFILAQGTPGQGSTFECYFPMHIPSEEKG